MLSDLEIIVKQRHTDNSRFSLLCVLRQQPGSSPRSPRPAPNISLRAGRKGPAFKPWIAPIVGSILGELVFLATQEIRKDGLTTSEKVSLTVINPLYVSDGYR